MTITKPKQRIPHIGFLALLALIIVAGGSVYVLEYNALAKARGEARRTREEIVRTKLEEADLKHVVFEATDLKKLQEVAALEGLTIEAEPNYVRIGTVPEAKNVVVLR